MNELKTQGITDYEFWDGIYLPTAKEGINAAHRQIVEYAKVAEWNEVCIAEEDIKFTAPGAWEYFLANKPTNYDLYLGSVFVGDLKEDNTVADFCGMTIYFVHRNFYNTFLSVDKFEHIDRALTGLGKYYVCHPFIATQWDGISGNTGKYENYDSMFKNRKLFGI